MSSCECNCSKDGLSKGCPEERKRNDRYALLWFLGVIVFGGLLTLVFSRIDRHMFDTNAQVLDFEAYRENRVAQTSIPSENVDPRVLASSPIKTKPGETEELKETN